MLAGGVGLLTWVGDRGKDRHTLSIWSEAGRGDTWLHLHGSILGCSARSHARWLWTNKLLFPKAQPGCWQDHRHLGVLAWIIMISINFIMRSSVSAGKQSLLTGHNKGRASRAPFCLADPWHSPQSPVKETG